MAALELVPARRAEEATRATPESPIRVLFLPDAPAGPTSERTPTLLRLIRERYPVAPLPAPWDPILYDPARPRAPRAMLYVVDKLLLFFHGLVLARRTRATVVFCETVHHALVGVVIARVLGIGCVWDSHGNGALLYESLGKGRGAARRIRALETFVGRHVDVLVTVSERDSAAYAEAGIPREKIRIIPVCVEVPPATVTDTREPNGHPVLLFFGSFRYAPNEEALRFLNGRLAPYLEHRGFSCEIRIAGRDIPTLDYHPSVRPVGFVPDVQAELRAATLCVVPVRRGVGTLTKVIDAMAVGTPVVLSEFAARGIPELRPGVHGYVAATEEEFLDRVAEALSHPEAARTMSRRARRLVEEGHDWNRRAGQVAEVLAAGASRPSGGGP